MKKILLTFMASFFIISGQAQLSNGLIGYYPFNNSTEDKSSKGLDASEFTAAYTSDRNGKSNSAVSFNGTQYIRLPYQTAYDGISLSVSLWFYSTSSDINQRLFVVNNTNEARQTFSLNYNVSSSGSVDLRMQPPAPAAGLEAFSHVTTKLNEWHHVVGIMDHGKEEVRVYLDKSFVGSATLKFFQVPGENVYIGRYDNITPQALKGRIDDIAIYNRILSQTEINQLFDGADPTAPPAGINASDAARTLSIYPNPARDQFSFSEAITGEVEIYDMCGKLQKKQLMQNESSLAISDLKAGVYSVRFGSQKFSLVKQ